jgi:hypothetical protein
VVLDPHALPLELLGALADRLAEGRVFVSLRVLTGSTSAIVTTASIVSLLVPAP